MAQPAIGIDLGTTYSALAVINPAGKPEIVANAEGERITASAVFFQEDGSVLVGQDAADSAVGFPDRVVRWVKREMGKSTWRFDVDGKSYRAEDISALVLRKLKKDAEAVLGPITHAVVTVPAYFDEHRRKATMDAAKAAGLELLKIINEPTAAAIAYATTGKVSGNMLVYDFGGGTFDVSIVRIDSPHDVAVIASEGDHDLGGYNLDHALAEHYDGLFFQEKSKKIKDDHAAWHALVQQAERDKCSLSRRKVVPAVALQGHGELINVSVERSTFESLIGDHLVRTEMLVENALTEAGLKVGDIDGILLVGGTTRIPAVRAMLEKKFSMPPTVGVNPDEAVALGAAIQAGVLMQEKGLLDVGAEGAHALSKTRIRDVTNHSFGTLALQEVHGTTRLRNSIIIPKNRPIPASLTDTFYTTSDNQETINCVITQGEDEDPEFVKKIVEGDMDLPAGRAQGCPIEVTYSYDHNGRMACVFKDVQSGRTKRFDLDMATQSKTTTAGDEAQPVIDASDLDDLTIE